MGPLVVEKGTVEYDEAIRLAASNFGVEFEREYSKMTKAELYRDIVATRLIEFNKVLPDSLLDVIKMIAEDYTDIVDELYTNGYEDGEWNGHESGYQDGKGDGYEKGREEGYDSGYEEGYEEGYEKGREEGYNTSYSVSIGG